MKSTFTLEQKQFLEDLIINQLAIIHGKLYFELSPQVVSELQAKLIELSNQIRSFELKEEQYGIAN